MRTLSAVLPPPTVVVAEIATALDDSGLPDVFVGLDPIQLPGVDIPTETQAGRIAAAAVTGTARISTRACDTQVTGTGTLVADEYLVTNAHVVAGASTILRRARRAAGGRHAGAVRSRPGHRGPARSPGLAGRPLRFTTADPERGAQGAVIRLPGGGSLTSSAAAGLGRLRATGRDIYGEHRVTRDILELRAAVGSGRLRRPARPRRRDDRGHRVRRVRERSPGVGTRCRPRDVAVRDAPVLGRTAAVDTGACLR